MTVSAEEFMRRFLLHVLPPGFVRIRYYGLLANGQHRRKLQRCRELLAVATVEAPPPTEDWATRLKRLTGQDVQRCPVCGQGQLVPRRAVTAAEAWLFSAALTWPTASVWERVN